MLPTRRDLVASLATLIAALCLSTAAAEAQPTFVDVTEAAGIDWTHWHGSVPPDLPPGDREVLQMSAGAAAGDFDSDGNVDLFLTRIDAPNALFRSLGDGTFHQVAHAAGVDLATFSTACAVGDVDGDGDLDIYVCTNAPDVRNYLYLNDGKGRFSEDAEARGVSLYVKDGVHRCTGAAFGDYDRDGDVDLATTAWQINGNKNRLLRNTGDGHFEDVTDIVGIDTEGVYGFSPRFADVDNDGWPDLLLAADYGTSRLFRNLGDGTFRNLTALAHIGTEENGMGSTLGDIDNDGDLDWFVTSVYDPGSTIYPQERLWGRSGNRLYRNTGGGLFVDDTDHCGVRNGHWGWGTSFFDYDNDGDLDLTMTNGVDFPWVPYEDAFHDDPMRMWNNDGTGVMTEVSKLCGLTDEREGKGLLTLDYDRDGDLDMLIVNNADQPVLYRNDGGNANAWLQVTLQGSITNRFGLGARVYVQVEDGGATQMREMSGGTNYMSQNEGILHFGLGSKSVTTIHRVRVVWPASGKEAVLSDVTANQRLHVAE